MRRYNTLQNECSRSKLEIRPDLPIDVALLFVLTVVNVVLRDVTFFVCLARPIDLGMCYSHLPWSIQRFVYVSFTISYWTSFATIFGGHLAEFSASNYIYFTVVNTTFNCSFLHTSLSLSFPKQKLRSQFT